MKNKTGLIFTKFATNIIIKSKGGIELMIGKIKEVNGEKKIEWIAGRAEGQGVPIGCIMAIYGNTAPNSSWLICDGSTFDAETYPALALYLGGNRLPDLRECVLVGAGQSSNEYDASTNPNGIHEHDVYTVGQFKDDQFQGHKHNYTKTSQVTVNFGGAPFNYGANEGADTTSTPVSDGTNGDPRTGTTTHGKQVGVNYIIKATSVSAETDHAAILAQIQRWNSYSTEETPTGKVWIDGKPIYRKCFTGLSISFPSGTPTGFINVVATSSIPNINKITSAALYSGDIAIQPPEYRVLSGYISCEMVNGGSRTVDSAVFEYTKTTD